MKTVVYRTPPIMELTAAAGASIAELIYYKVDGVLRDFTGWTASVQVSPAAEVARYATVALNSVGEITFDLPAEQTAKMKGRYTARIFASDGTDTDALVDINLIITTP